MLKLDINKFVTEVQKAAPFEMPYMEKGVKYLYDRVFYPMTMGIDVRLLDLDFDAFDENDISELHDLYGNIFENQGYKASGIVNHLQQMNPVCKAAAYV